jgi:hypothetical protein
MILVFTALGAEKMITFGDRFVPCLLRFVPAATHSRPTILRFLKEMGDEDPGTVSDLIFESGSLSEAAIASLPFETRNHLISLTIVLDLMKSVALGMKHIADSELNPNIFIEFLEAAIEGLSDDDAQNIRGECLRPFPSFTGVAVVNLSRVVTTLLPLVPAVDQEHISALCNLLPIAFSTGDQMIRTEFFTLISAALPLTQQKLLPTIRSSMTITTDQWNYNAEAHVQPATSFLGLRNLGATCYLNSVL